MKVTIKSSGTDAAGNARKKLNFFISNFINEKKIKNISGVTLIEILIGVVISVVMMAAMFTFIML